MNRRQGLWLSLAALLACQKPASSASPGNREPRHAAVADEFPSRARPEDFSALAPRFAKRVPASRRAEDRDPAVRIDEARGVPSFRWAPAAPGRAAASALSTGQAATSTRAGLVALARAHLADGASLYGLAASDVDAARVVNVHDTGHGAIIVTFDRPVDGIEVFRGTTAIAMDRGGALVAQSGALVPSSARREGARFLLDGGEAIGRALTDATGDAYAAGDLVADRADEAGFSRFGLSPVTGHARGASFTRPARARRVWFPLPEGLEPAWHVEVGVAPSGGREPLELAYVISARDGRLLFRRDLVDHAFTYRVYADPATLWPYDGPQGFAGSPHPTGLADGYQSPFVPQTDITLDNAGFGVPSGDVWLPPGAVTTTGNNVDAYADIDDQDGYNAGDVRANTTGSGEFRYGFDHATDPKIATNRKAGIVNLFYVNNFLHDWYYAAGFDEAARNAQTDNMGRGGVGGDPIHAEAQDTSGTASPMLDNANMLTPADGASPRMQMYLWFPNVAHSVTVVSPSDLAQTAAGGMQMGWGPDSYDVTGELVLADDGTAPTADACTSLVNGSAVSGKVVLVDRGTCTFVQKVSAAQAAGATGVIIRNVTADQTYANMAGTSGTIHIPALLVEQDLGQALGNALATGPVQVTLERSAGQYRDGDIDGSIIAHEWTHYLTNRLIGNATGIDTHMARGLGEGWSDFHSLLMMIRAEDVQVPANSGWQGLYVEAAYSDGGQYALGGDNDSFYWGIRRVPYSTDFSKDPLTFRHIAAWEPIPTQTPDGTPIPVQFGADGSWNTEIHATGEVWTTMLWECYASLLRDVPARLSFAEAQDRMKRYMVASYKLMPMSPTLLEARDAVLAAVYAEDHTDFELFFDAFARRGAGIGAVGPYRYREDNAPVVESYASGPDLAPGAIQVTELAGPCDDADGVLDDEETAVVAVDLGNVGSRDLAGATITLSSPDPRVTFPAGTSIPVAATVARGSGSRTTVDFQVSLSGAYRGEVMPVDLGFPAGYLRTDAPRRIWLRTNFDDQAAASKVERFESERFAWAFAGGQPSDFGRVELDATHHELQGLDVGHAADLRVASPALQVGTDPLVVTWRHRHGFETFEVLLSTGAVKTINGDGAVVELSQDGGVTWTDVGHLATTARGPLYSGILSYPAELGTTANPLRNVSSAIVGTNPSFPDFDDVRLDLGTAYAGKSVELRFRIGTDESGGGAPWEIDDLAVSGIVNTPFPDLIEDQNVCGTGGPVATAGQDLRVPRGATVTLDASASAAEDPAAVLTFAWTQTGGLPVTLTGGDTPWPSFTAPEVSADSDLTFQVTVSAGGSSSSASVVVTVFPANRSPVAIIAGPATVSADEGTQVTLDGSGSTDPDPGDVLTYAWTRVSGPSVSLSGTATPVASFTTPQVSSDTPLVLRLEVSDGTLTSSALVIVNVHDVRAVAGQTSGGGCTSGGVGGPMALLALLGLARVRRPRRP